MNYCSQYLPNHATNSKIVARQIYEEKHCTEDDVEFCNAEEKIIEHENNLIAMFQINGNDL